VTGDPQGDPGGHPAGEGAVDDDLLLRFRLGDRAAFDAIVTRYQGALTRFFYRLCWDQDRAEDFVQDVYLKILRGAASYEPRGRLSTFLFRIATNRWIDHYRSLRPRPNIYSLDRVETEDETPLADRLPAVLPDSGDAMDTDQEKRRLRAALDCLSLPHRLVVELAVYQQLPYHDIAQLLDIPEGTVKSRMHNAAKHLRQLLELPPQEGRDAAVPDRAPQGGARRRHIA
jgi:RNA polymerase sigma-70 factor (ECF subfamily)